MSDTRFQLHYALADSGCKLETIENLLKDNLDVKVFNEKGQLPIHVAVANPHCRPEVIALLISKGASVNAKNNREETPLHLAVKQLNCQYEIIKLLLNKQCDVNAQDNFRNTPLHIAVHEHHYNIPIIELLLGYKADVMITNEEGLIPLYVAFENPNCSVELVRILMKGFNYRIFNYSRFTPLQTYIKQSNFQVDIFEELVNQGANLWKKSEFTERNILHHAVTAKKSFIILSAIIKIILKHKHNCKISDMVNEMDINLDTPLDLALKVDHIDINVISLLLKHGADPDQKIPFETPLDLAILACHQKAVELLLIYRHSTDKRLSFLEITSNYLHDKEQYSSCFWTVVKYYVKETFCEDVHLLKNLRDFMNRGLSLSDIVDVKNFIEECCQELQRMKEEMLTSCFSLYDLILMPRIIAKKCILRKKLSVSHCRDYNIYHNNIAHYFYRSQLLSELQNQRIYVEENNVRISLVPDCADVIGYYLSKEDLLSLILAFYKPVDQQNVKLKSFKRPNLESVADYSNKRSKITDDELIFPNLLTNFDKSLQSSSSSLSAPEVYEASSSI